MCNMFACVVLTSFDDRVFFCDLFYFQYSNVRIFVYIDILHILYDILFIYSYIYIYLYHVMFRDVCVIQFYLTQSQDGPELPSARAHSADSCRSQGGLLVIGLVVTATQMMIQEFKKMHDY